VGLRQEVMRETVLVARCDECGVEHDPRDPEAAIVPVDERGLPEGWLEVSLEVETGGGCGGRYQLSDAVFCSAGCLGRYVEVLA
jgi:hypothetical protein